MMIKARVFISCGQSTAEEKEIGNAVVDYFKKRGFEPYFAEEVHSPLGLTQNIFESLKRSEYFVCINPTRDNSDFGSLFVQQELAIASFLELPLVAFHQPGVRLQGVAKYLHVNSLQMNTISEMLAYLERYTAQWEPESKNQFRLSWGHESLNVAILNQNRQLSNWYHIKVENLSAVIHAKNCYCYIESIHDLLADKQLFGKNEYKNELSWAGTDHTNVDIPRQAKRDIDAIFTVLGSSWWVFNERSTSTIYRYPRLPDGKYKITYVAHSDNFPTAELEVQLALSNDRLTVVNQIQID
jgi:hypothetical protein